ncbi:MAG: carbohydrate-binding domain-containing protein [Oscillospiraceae bacterium]|nr:carbohydrate-binding domain-containing protein [Oscillospiraceae bacterium]
MGMNIKTLAALCSVAVSLASGCHRIDIDSAPDINGVSPMYPHSDTEAALVPEKAETEDFKPASSEDDVIVFADDEISFVSPYVERQGYAAVIRQGGVYRVTGTMDGGRVVVDCDDPVSLILDGLNIQSIACIGAAQLKITVPSDTDNRLSGDAMGSGISSGSSIIVNGSGRLDIGGSTAISCAALKLCGADVSVVSEKDGIKSTEYVVMAEGSLNIRSGGKGVNIRNERSQGYMNIIGGKLEINSYEDGICASDAVFVSNGSVDIRSGGGSGAVLHFGRNKIYPKGKHGGFTTDGSADFDFDDLTSGDGSKVESKKGISTDGIVEISGGDVVIDSADDSISAHSDIDVSGGTLKVCSGDDGMHCDNRITVYDGCIRIDDSYIALEGLSVAIKGGDVALISYYDGINVAGGNNMISSGAADSAEKYISISGGKVCIKAGGDGIDSAGTAAISGGDVLVFSGNESGFASLDYSGSFVLSGGTLAAFGSDVLTKAPSIVSSSCISVMADLTKGELLTIKDSTNSIVFETVMVSDCSSVIFSYDDITIGQIYSIYADGVCVNSVTASEGVCGDGPSGIETGVFDNVISGSQGNTGELVA